MAVGDLAIGGSMPDATVGQPYRQPPLVTGGFPPYKFRCQSDVPLGWAHSDTTGEFITLAVPGTFPPNVTQQVTDSVGQIAVRSVSINVGGRNSPSSAGSVVATLADPFGRRKGSQTTYAAIGAVPPQLQLVGNQILTTATPPTPGVAYAITILASNGTLPPIQQTLTFTGVAAGSTSFWARAAFWSASPFWSN